MITRVGSGKELLAAKGKHIDIYVSCDFNEAATILLDKKRYYVDSEREGHPDPEFTGERDITNDCSGFTLRHMNNILLDGTALSLEEMLLTKAKTGFPTQTLLRLYTGATKGREGVIEELRVLFQERGQNIAFFDERHTKAYVCLDEWYAMRAGTNPSY
jgi:hypothetical protein